MQKNERITVEEINEYISEGYKVVDIREKSELLNIPKMKVAENIPMSGMLLNTEKFFPDKNEKIILVCNSGQRSNNIRNKMLEKGYENVVDVEGGILAVRENEDIELDK